MPIDLCRTLSQESLRNYPSSFQAPLVDSTTAELEPDMRALPWPWLLVGFPHAWTTAGGPADPVPVELEELRKDCEDHGTRDGLRPSRLTSEPIGN